MTNITPDHVGQLLRIEEVAAKLAVRPRTIQCWMAARKIPYIKLGHTVRFRPSDIEQMLDACAAGRINR
jgi:excisionase family DNA binding protein